MSNACPSFRSPVSPRRQRGMTRNDLAITWLFAGATFLGILGWANHVHCGGWSEKRLENVAGQMVAMTQFAALGGVDLVDPTDLDRTIALIAEGVSPSTGPFAGQCHYGVRELDAKGRERVKAYLKLEGNRLVLTRQSS